MTEVADLSEEKLERRAKIATEEMGTSHDQVWQSSFKVVIEELAERRDEDPEALAESYVSAGKAAKLLRDRESPTEVSP